jgi:hypothetical protein
MAFRRETLEKPLKQETLDHLPTLRCFMSRDIREPTKQLRCLSITELRYVIMTSYNRLREELEERERRAFI